VKIEYLADRQEHVATVAAWHRHEWGHLRPEESLEIRASKLRASSGHREIPTVFIASTGSTLLGSAMLVVHDMDSRLQWSPWLAGVVVAPEHRGRGVGAALAEHAAAEARALGWPALYLYTFSTEQYYARLGWQLIEHSSYFGQPVSIMSRSFHDNSLVA
jgi:predicted N-acetyltransferase YhbS